MKKKTLILFLAATTALFTLNGWSFKKDENDFSKYVELGQYTGLEIERYVTTVTDEAVDEEIEYELYYNADYEDITDRPAKEGDIAVIDFTGTIDGEEFEGGSDTDYELELGAGMFLEDFENEVIGMPLDETKEFSVTFPEDYDEELGGKTADFSVTLTSLTEIKLPELNDTYVQENTDYSSVEEYKAALKDTMQMNYDSDADYAASCDALAQIVENSVISDYPEELYQEEKKNMEDSYAQFAEELGMDLSELMGDDYDMDEDIMSSVYEKMVVYTLAAKEDLIATDADYESFLESSYELYGYDNPEDFVNDYTEEALRYELTYENVLNFLSLNNNFVDTEYDFDNYGTIEDAEFEDADEVIEIDASDLEDGDLEFVLSDAEEDEEADETEEAEETEAEEAESEE